MRSASSKSQDRNLAVTTSSQNRSFRRPFSAKHSNGAGATAINSVTQRNFHFSPFGTVKSKEEELKARLTRDRELKSNKIKQLTH